ncbi:universal stress protein UspA [Saccharomonospora piscinae]|uniref:Universal stress protein UspA n=1 Tax=Saccharomonospora piscinae TaxID=687388 RepID=A0A1V9A524_SACPI|nr:universal stress protein [Saccharomonospora piscinae]OQO92242.1 universal stress protein UspA [Saccharomonospora piscinae]TLW92053.1 universal stress protein [Saccharomonospora piscinae]
MPLRRVLVATDLSARSGVALRRAARLASLHRAELTALFAVPLPADDDLTAVAAEALRAHTAEYIGTRAAMVVRSGSPAETIVAEAVDGSTDLLVLGAHGLRGLVGALVGSTTENVVHASPCPVLVVRTPVTADYDTVLLGVDDSATARTAARFGAALTPGADHTVVHVSVVIGEQLLRLRGLDDADLERLRAASTAEIRPRIEEFAATLRPGPATVVVGSGSPQRVLPELAARRKADLVVTGTGTTSRFERALLGSVAQNAVRHSPTDVLVVPGDRDGAAAG